MEFFSVEEDRSSMSVTGTCTYGNYLTWEAAKKAIDRFSLKTRTKTVEIILLYGNVECKTKDGQIYIEDCFKLYGKDEYFITEFYIRKWKLLQ